MNVKYIYSGIIGVLKYEGLKSLISRGYSFLLHRLFQFEEYFVTYTDLENTAKEDEVEFFPRTDDYYLKIIATNEEADELVTKGFKFEAYELNVRASLDKGALVFCIFIGKELAHIVCAADNLRGKEAIDSHPFTVNFKNGEIVTGKVLTMPKFRRLHLRTYSGYTLRKFCLEKGISRIKGTLRANNYEAMASIARFTHHKAVSKCRFIKILWFKYLKETKMEPTTMRQIFEQEYSHAKKDTDAIIPTKK